MDRSLDTLTRRLRGFFGAGVSSRLLGATAAISAAIVGVSMFTAAQMARFWMEGPGVSINPKLLTWVRGVRLSAAVYELPMDEARADVPVRVSLSAPIRSDRPVSRRVSVNRPLRPRTIVRKVPRAVRVPVRINPKHEIAPAIAIEEVAPVPAPPAILVSAPVTNQIERTRMLLAYRAFRSQWLAKVDIRESIQYSQSAVAETRVESELSVDPVPLSRAIVAKRPVPTKRRTIQSARRRAPTPQVAETTDPVPTLDPAPPAPDLIELSRVAADQATARSLRLAADLREKADSLGLHAEVSSSTADSSASQIDVISETETPILMSQPAPARTTPQAAPTIPALPSIPIAPPVFAPAIPTTPLADQIVVAQSSVTTQPHQSAVTTQGVQSQPGYPKDGKSAAPYGTEHGFMSSGRTTQSTAVEAFDPTTQIASPKHQVYSSEGRSGGEQSQWVMTSSANHWPTLSLEPGGAIDSNRPVALISSNSALLLARIAGVELQSQAGIIFGRVEKGWTVETSGRAERIIYLNDERLPVPQNDLSVARNFALINVAPGAQLLSAVDRSGLARAVAAIPVLEGVATYVEATEVETREISGSLLNGSSRSAEGVPASTLRVAGQAGKSATTRKNGDFNIIGIRTIGAHPVYLESAGANSYVHRYRVSFEGAGATRTIQLFQFDTQQIQGWVRQLEGGVSAESGLLIAAAPEAVAAHGPEPLSPVIRTLTTNPTLTPESYRLSADEALQVGPGLDPASPRFVTVQIPEGPSVVSLETRAEKPVVSEVVFSSPGVVNVFGPY